MTTYFGFAIADSMFPPECSIRRQSLSPGVVKALIDKGVVSCINPSHTATINLMHQRFGLDVSVPDSAPNIILEPGDELIIMSICNLPRLSDRHEYTREEVEKAEISFGLYKIE